MGSIFKKYPDFILLSLAILFMTILAVSFIWGVQVLITNLNKAINLKPPESSTKIRFDLGGAKALDLKGLIQQ